MKEIFVAFISKKLKHDFELLKEGKFEDKQLYGYIDRAMDDLKKNPACGTKIQKNYGLKFMFESMGLIICGNMIYQMVGGLYIQ